MTEKYTPGKIKKVVLQITRYEGLSSPNIDIPIEEEYTIETVGSISGVDRELIQGHGKPVSKISEIPIKRKDKTKTFKEAYKNIIKKGGLSSGKVKEINDLIEKYNLEVIAYQEVKEQRNVKTLSEEDMDATTALKDLENLLKEDK